jgi:hypothetical protein
MVTKVFIGTEIFVMATERKGKHLILALGRQGLGEASLGVLLAHQLRARGDEVFFLTHEANSKLVESRFPFFAFGSEASPLFQFFTELCLSRFKATSIILSDYFAASCFCYRYGMDPQNLFSLGLPLIAIDTWDSSRWTDRVDIDVFVDACRSVRLWPGPIECVCPVPFLAPHTGSRFYSSLPQGVRASAKVREGVREKLGVRGAAKAVLFCTANWQHPDYESQFGAAVTSATSLPALVAAYLAQLGESVHLVHVGPRPFNLSPHINGRYHWLPPMSGTEFDTLVASMDLLLSANISATTIAKAMVCEIPILVLQSSILAMTLQEAKSALPDLAGPSLSAWLQNALPLFPFSMWPLGYHRFISRLLADSPYMHALKVVEVLDEERVEAALSSLLFDNVARQEDLHHQNIYLQQLQSLPSGDELVHGILN